MQTKTSLAHRQGCAIDPVAQHPYHPIPDPVTGHLLVDPDIVLKAKAFNLAVEFFYSANTDTVTPFGAARSASVQGRILSYTDASNKLTVQRGDFSELNHGLIGSAGGLTTYMYGSLSQGPSTLVYNGTKFTELLTDGMQLVYQAQLGAGNPVTHQLVGVQDPNGNIHTYAYGSGAEAGLLKTVQVPGGNLLTMVYAPGTTTSLLSLVQDWGGPHLDLPI